MAGVWLVIGALSVVLVGLTMYSLSVTPSSNAPSEPVSAGGEVVDSLPQVVVPSGGGGGASGVSAVRQPVASEIVNLSLCSSDVMPCVPVSEQVQVNTDVTIFWQVVNGIGCCATFHCNYGLFKAVCLEPFSLYALSLDGVDVDLSDLSDYFYKCVSVVPYEYVSFANLSLGVHTIGIVQRDCGIGVVDAENISFILSEANDGLFELRRI